MLKQKEELKEGGRRVFQEFCESISLHGYSYLSNANSIFSKFFWFLVILVMTSSGIFLIVENTTEYLNAGIVTTIQSSSSDLKVSIRLRYFFSIFNEYFSKGWVFLLLAFMLASIRPLTAASAASRCQFLFIEMPVY